MRGDRRSDTLSTRMARAAWRGRTALAVGLISTLVPAVLLTYAHDRPYHAQAYMLVRQLPSDVDAGTTVADPVRRLANEISVLEGDDVAARVRDTLGIGGEVPPVTGEISTQVDVVIARVQSVSAELAAELANAYVQAYIDVQAEQMQATLTRAIDQLQDESASLQAQIDDLSTDNVQLAALLDERTRTEAALQSLTVDLTVAADPAQNIRPAAVPSDPESPDLLRPVLLAVLVGLVLGAIGSLILNRRADEVRNATDLATLRSTEPVLAVVPLDRSSSATPVILRQPKGRSMDSYIALRDALQQLAIDRDVDVVQFCSPNDGNGATTTAVNVAILLARTGTSVALVDLDLRAPRVHTMLHLERSPGVTDALDDDSPHSATSRSTALQRLWRMDRPAATQAVTRNDDFDDVLLDDVLLEDMSLEDMSLEDGDARPLSIPVQRFEDLAVITSGTAPRSPLEVLSRRRLDDLIADLRRSYDLVIIDSPAALTGGDATAIGRHADGVVMVVRAGDNTMSVVRRSLGTVHRSGTHVLGVVLAGASS
jgi:Mrp family chromosome partitioning ATPase/cell division protein FtsB